MNNVDQFAEVVAAAYKRLINRGDIISLRMDATGLVEVHLQDVPFDAASDEGELQFLSRNCAKYNTEVYYRTPSGCKVFCLKDIKEVA